MLAGAPEPQVDRAAANCGGGADDVHLVAGDLDQTDLVLAVPVRERAPVVVDEELLLGEYPLVFKTAELRGQSFGTKNENRPRSG
jgi:hypothetical protein